MWKILNKLFGWDYILWRNPADNGLARVQKSQDGRVFYWRYKSTNVVDEIVNPEQVFWLTCLPTKYFPSERSE